MPTLFDFAKISDAFDISSTSAFDVVKGMDDLPLLPRTSVFVTKSPSGDFVISNDYASVMSSVFEYDGVTDVMETELSRSSLVDRKVSIGVWAGDYRISIITSKVKALIALILSDAELADRCKKLIAGLIHWEQAK